MAAGGSSGGDADVVVNNRSVFVHVSSGAVPTWSCYVSTKETGTRLVDHFVTESKERMRAVNVQSGTVRAKCLLRWLSSVPDLPMLNGRLSGFLIPES